MLPNEAELLFNDSSGIYIPQRFSISSSIRDNIDDSWRVTGVLICYEDTYCDHTGELIR